MTTRQQGQTVSQFTYLTTLLAAVSQLTTKQKLIEVLKGLSLEPNKLPGELRVNI